jgi:Lrp/AsnC family transcriptional regulator, regulator for asnA, asnC and gidA
MNSFSSIYVNLSFMDDLDIQILTALSNNSRKSYVELANELEVSDATVHNRIRSLIDSGVIKGFVTLIDFEKMGFGVVAFVELKAKPGTADQVTQKLARIRGIVGIYEMHSDCDILIKIAARDLKDLRDKIVNEIGKIPEIVSNQNNTVLNLVKEDFIPPFLSPHVERIYPNKA